MTVLTLIVLATGLAAQPAPAAAAAAKRRVILLDLSSNGVPKDLVRTLGDVLSTELSKRALFDVVTAADIRAMTNVEASKQELTSTCSADDTCMAEIATALGADVIVHGSVGLLGTSYVAAVSLFDAKAAKAIAREKVQADDTALLAHKLERAAARLADAYEGKAPQPVDDDAPLRTPLLIVGGVGAGLGLVAFAAGGFFSLGSAAVLDDKTAPRADKDKAVADYPLQTGLAIGGVVVAVAGAALAGVALVSP